MKKLMIALLGTIVYTQSVAQTTWKNYTNTSTNQGLISGSVRAITEDKQGNMWFGTDNGVSKFDGANWISYTNANTSQGLVSDPIQAIAEDNKGNMWFGTKYNGISKFDGVNWTTYNYSATSISIDKHGNTWLGGGNGVCKFNDTSWTCYAKAVGQYGYIQEVYSSAVDTAGNVWFGAYTGLYKNSDTSVYKVVGAPYFINSVAVDEQNNIWMGMFYSGGAKKFDGINWTSYTRSITNDAMKNDTVEVIASDKKGNIWMAYGYNGGGVTKFNGASWKTYAEIDGLLSDFVNVIFIDSKGNKWFGTGNQWAQDGWSGVSMLSDGLTTRIEELYNSVKVYPNPFSDQTVLYFSKSLTNASIQLLDISGREMNNVNFSGQQIVIEKGNLSSGIYFVKVLSNNEAISTHKIIIQ